MSETSHHREPHRHHHHHHHRHHEHSGDWFDVDDDGGHDTVTNVTHEGDTAYHHHSHSHVDANAAGVFQQCLALLRGVQSDEKRTQVLGQLLASLRHQNMLPSLSMVLERAMPA